MSLLKCFIEGLKSIPCELLLDIDGCDAARIVGFIVFIFAVSFTLAIIITMVVL